MDASFAAVRLAISATPCKSDQDQQLSFKRLSMEQGIPSNNLTSLPPSLFKVAAILTRARTAALPFSDNCVLSSL
jgi:hypothetical protein